MTDKIIIDGIDVSGCKKFDADSYRLNVFDCDLSECGNYCKGNPNCDYKHLQRTTAQYNAVVEQNKSLQVELKQKQQECERMYIALKKIRNYELEQLDIDWDEYETCCRETEYSPIIDYCEVGLGEVKEENECSCREHQSYKQALDEIEKIARHTRDNEMKGKSIKNDYYNAMIFGLGGLTQILDIINKEKEIERKE